MTKKVAMKIIINAAADWKMSSYINNIPGESNLKLYNIIEDTIQIIDSAHELGTE